MSRDPFACHAEDERIRCVDCRAHRPEYGCQVAKEVTGNYRWCSPPELRHRCADYWPKRDQADQRRGAERWPDLVEYPGGPRLVPFPRDWGETREVRRRKP
jgi:hypothetical protein